MNNLIHEIIALFGDTALGLLGVAGAWLTAKVAGLVKSQRISNIILRVDDAAMKVARDVFAAWVEPRRDAGEWNDATKTEGKLMALLALNSYLGSKGLSELLVVFGGNILARDSYLGAAVENAIVVSKNEAALVNRLGVAKKT